MWLDSWQMLAAIEDTRVGCVLELILVRWRLAYSFRSRFRPTWWLHDGSSQVVQHRQIVTRK